VLLEKRGNRFADQRRRHVCDARAGALPSLLLRPQSLAVLVPARTCAGVLLVVGRGDGRSFVDDVGTVAYSVSSDVVIWQSIGVISTRGRRATGGNHRVAGRFHGWNRGGENHKVSTALRRRAVKWWQPQQQALGSLAGNRQAEGDCVLTGCAGWEARPCVRNRRDTERSSGDRQVCQARSRYDPTGGRGVRRDGWQRAGWAGQYRRATGGDGIGLHTMSQCLAPWKVPV
jgi:hypothetical protein